ncbi:hypothetical protein [Citromicrobium sp. WPS32]|uniref:hypothetical protein n=1 Tax=Citromicrobium sp. WPS32 TaxID=1634517 RepID=UPI0006C91FC1|nr:hypothetical protein [Citromicrobium sp. WPS32]|tara:strand:- start:7655 stop:8098 length:444 start_codon:yes stop_codon:yes gene_type:complete
MRSQTILPLAALLLASAACTNEAAAPQPDANEAAAQPTRAPLKLAGQYKAFLYGPDHTSASGARLDQAWQVLQQDRANYHERDVRQDADQSDPVFASAANRDRIEDMVANGNLTDASARKIMDGNVLVAVDVYTRDGEPARLDVSVY